MKRQLDLNQIAEGLGAERAGKVRSSPGYFGAMHLASEVARRLRVPRGGGRPTDPEWTERRLIPLSRGTLKRLEELASLLQVAPLQMAAILLEKTVDSIRDEELQQLSQAASGSK